MGFSLSIDPVARTDFAAAVDDARPLYDIGAESERLLAAAKEEVKRLARLEIFAGAEMLYAGISGHVTEAPRTGPGWWAARARVRRSPARNPHALTLTIAETTLS